MTGICHNVPPRTGKKNIVMQMSLKRSFINRYVCNSNSCTSIRQVKNPITSHELIVCGFVSKDFDAVTTWTHKNITYNKNATSTREKGFRDKILTASNMETKMCWPVFHL